MKWHKLSSMYEAHLIELFENILKKMHVLYYYKINDQANLYHDEVIQI